MKKILTFFLSILVFPKIVHFCEFLIGKQPGEKAINLSPADIITISIVSLGYVFIVLYLILPDWVLKAGKREE